MTVHSLLAWTTPCLRRARADRGVRDHAPPPMRPPRRVGTTPLLLPALLLLLAVGSCARGESEPRRRGARASRGAPASNQLTRDDKVARELPQNTNIIKGEEDGAVCACAGAPLPRPYARLA